MVLHVHLEEQQKEIDDCIAVHGMSPLALLLEAVPAEQLGKTVAVHCTHSTQAELAQLIATGAGVCVCPLTEAALGDGVFQSLEATRGVVSLGTDCNARIDMFEEMRLLEYSQRLARGRRGVLSSVAADHASGHGTDGDLGRQLMACASQHGASALNVDAGAIAVGRWADFALLDLGAAALCDVSEQHMMAAMVFGGSAEGMVLNSCVAGRWTKDI